MRHTGNSLMDIRDMRFLQYRLSVLEMTPSSPYREATLAAIRTRIAGLNAHSHAAVALAAGGAKEIALCR